jgi:hypothetical protein
VLLVIPHISEALLKNIENPTAMTVNQKWHGSFQFALEKSGHKRTSVNDMKRTYGLHNKKTQ